MSAVVCGGKRSYHSFFDEVSPSPSSISKRLRSCGSEKFSSLSPTASPATLFSPSSASPLLHHLKSRFPAADPQLLERVLEECGYNLEFAMERLNEHDLGSTEEAVAKMEQGVLTNDGDPAVAAASDGISPPSNLPSNGAEWVDQFVREMMTATSIDDARARASRMLEIFEKSVIAQSAEGAAETFQKESMVMKEQIEVVTRENVILKRAVAIQHERQKEFEDKNRELHHLKQMLTEYQERVRALEVNNYALTMHLKQSQQSNSIPGRYHPDVF